MNHKSNDNSSAYPFKQLANDFFLCNETRLLNALNFSSHAKQDKCFAKVLKITMIIENATNVSYSSNKIPMIIQLRRCLT